MMYKPYQRPSYPPFRAGPVPYTGKWFRCHFRMRLPRTTQELRMNCDPEYGKFARPNRKHLPTSWDDIFVRRTRSWKAQKKKRQWM